ncbi:MAG: tetratricopeptide repeat protein [Flavobacterium sp.]
MFRKIIIPIVILITFFLLVRFFISSQAGALYSDYTEVKSVQNSYLGDQSCKECHKQEYKEWRQSDHFMSMNVANGSSVKGNFNNVTFKGDGVTSRFFKKGNVFYINTEGEDGKYHDFEVKYTFGGRPLQQYLIQFSGGRLQVPRLSWDTNKKRWFNQYAGQKIPSHDWLHWTKNAQNWNTMCAVCHSTNLQKKYDVHADTYKSTYSVMNVSCESCHGPGGQHVDLAKTGDLQKGEKRKAGFSKIFVGNYATEQINKCAPCHALITEISPNHIDSKEIMDNYIAQIPETQNFYADGQVKNEDYNYTSFSQSKMYSAGVKCSDCHNPHTTKLKRVGNLTCTSCHVQRKYDTPLHTFHKSGSEGSKCVSCHMPGKVYMGNDLRHDHVFRVPRPDLSAKYEVPNACSSCHRNKSNAFLAQSIVKWYGPKRVYHFSDDLIPGSKLDDKSEMHLLRLVNIKEVPSIIKATAAFYLGSITSQNSLKALLLCLKSKDAQVRYRGLRSLANFSVSSWVLEVGPLLKDKVRAVRIAAADLYITIPIEQVPSLYTSDLISAQKELKSYLMYQADFSAGNVLIADYFFKLQDYNIAEQFYLKGLKKDANMNYALFNLSTVYNIVGKNDLALKTLEKAIKNDPKNDRIYYNMALIYSELGYKEFAEKNFAKSIALKTTNPRVYYNYGLLLNENKNYLGAIDVLQKGLKLAPSDTDLLYALIFVNTQANKKYKAISYVIKLKKLAPNHSDYQELFRSYGL